MVDYDVFACDDPCIMKKLVNFGILVCDETEKLKKLLENLYDNGVEESQVIVIVDSNKTNDNVKILLKKLIHYYHPLHYMSEQRMFLKEKCWLPYIFMLDVDESISKEALEAVIASCCAALNPLVMGIPRLNLTIKEDKSIEKTHWPDYQFRLVRNCNRLKWMGKVHEAIFIDEKWHNSYISLPAEEKYAIQHIKTAAEILERQKDWKRIEKL